MQCLGVHYYKYVVDGEWMHNPNKECEEDEKGNINNVMRIESKLTRKLAKPKPRLKVKPKPAATTTSAGPAWR